MAWPVLTRLYLPRDWADDQPRRQAAHIPPAVGCQTKADLALGLLDEANRCGVRHRVVVVDADYGDNPNFLNGLEQRREPSCVAVRANFSVVRTRKVDEAAHRADEVLTDLPAGQWRTISWKEGAKGRLRAKFVAVRCRRVDGDGSRHIGWLLGQRPGRGQSGERKYFWSNFGARTPLEVMVEYAHRRHWVEQFHEEAKGELGWNQFQGRRGDGFHRNAGTVMLSDSFLVWLEWREREPRRLRGRPRRDFSPSAGSATKIPGVCASASCRLDENRRGKRVGKKGSH